MADDLRALINNILAAFFFQPYRLSSRHNVRGGDVRGLAVDRHLMPAKPLVVPVVGERDVIGRRERPLSRPVHQERHVLNVVVLIHGKTVERHHPVKLLDFFGHKSDFSHVSCGKLIAAHGRLQIADMRDAPERLHVDFPAVCAVKTFRHKMIVAPRAVNPAFAHLDSAGNRHFVIGILNQSVFGPVLKPVVTVLGNVVEFHQPVVEPIPKLQLP